MIDRNEFAPCLQCRATNAAVPHLPPSDCISCSHNRRVIAELTRERDEARHQSVTNLQIVDTANAVSLAAVAVAEQLRAEADRMRPVYEAAKRWAAVEDHAEVVTYGELDAALESAVRAAVVGEGK